MRDYLSDQATLSPLSNGLVVFLIYQNAVQPHTHSELILGVLAAIILGQAVRVPRAVLYALLLAALAFQVHYLTHVAANGPQDALSTRDDAIEGTARALQRGENPWSQLAPLDAVPTTGPASALMAMPFVAMFGEVNWLSFLFWMAFFGMLLCFDADRRNESFPVLVLLFITGELGFGLTLYWSLDELYYPYLLLGVSYVCLKRGWLVGAGALLVSTIMFRTSYVFMAAACVAWFLFEKRRTPRDVLRLAVGGVSAALLILLPFAIIGGREFVAHNPFSTAYEMSGAVAWPDTNPAFRILNTLALALDPLGMRMAKLALMAAVLLVISIRLRKRSTHPFWHVAAAGLLTYIVAWYPGSVARDYALNAVLPAFMATACAVGDGGFQS